MRNRWIENAWNKPGNLCTVLMHQDIGDTRTYQQVEVRFVGNFAISSCNISLSFDFVAEMSGKSFQSGNHTAFGYCSPIVRVGETIWSSHFICVATAHIVISCIVRDRCDEYYFKCSRSSDSHIPFYCHQFVLIGTLETIIIGNWNFKTPTSRLFTKRYKMRHLKKINSANVRWPRLLQ